VDPHADPNPSLHFNADPDPGFTLMRLWEYATTGLQTPPVLHFVSVHGPTRLYFEPLKLLNFDLIADPDPAFKSNKDLDPALENNAKSGSATLARRNRICRRIRTAPDSAFQTERDRTKVNIAYLGGTGIADCAS
jgi:hypothetical protein